MKNKKGKENGEEKDILTQIFELDDKINTINRRLEYVKT